MKRILFALFFAFILFGCINLGDGTTPSNQSQQPSGDEDNDSVTIVVGPQQNNTIDSNQTEEPPPELVEPPKIEYVETPDEPFAIYVIHVGDEGSELQGDAILIKKGDFDMLMDAGPAQTANRVIDFMKGKGIDDIEVLVLTNADPQHYGGVPLVLEQYEVEEFWWPGGSYFSDTAYRDVVGNASVKAKIVREVQRGYERTLNGMTFEVLNPTKTNRFEDVNNDAIVTRFTDRNFTMLFTSGIQTGAQGKLINEQPKQIVCDVMQAPYYGLGAGTANIGILLIHSKPKTMIISGSEDKTTDGRSSREPFFRYMQQYNVEWFTTYSKGSVRIIGDGSEYNVAYLG